MYSKFYYYIMLFHFFKNRDEGLTSKQNFVTLCYNFVTTSINYPKFAVFLLISKNAVFFNHPVHRILVYSKFDG